MWFVCLTIGVVVSQGIFVSIFGMETKRSCNSVLASNVLSFVLESCIVHLYLLFEVNITTVSFNKFMNLSRENHLKKNVLKILAIFVGSHWAWNLKFYWNRTPRCFSGNFGTFFSKNFVLEQQSVVYIGSCQTSVTAIFGDNN